eukprot:TRINITY_DN7195_c0_g1_i1.p1 TRINITY_DN7195_c0_g1~~TRINITY_DN7195_c0_g1_i1.p1  ORF type:complete len:454 (-),score=132.71 TRINITY_DN7195_c0_g1_i1:62-1396(-)
MSSDHDFADLLSGNTEDVLRNLSFLEKKVSKTKKRDEQTEDLMKKLKRGSTVNLTELNSALNDKKSGSPTVSSKEAKKDRDNSKQLIKLRKGKSLHDLTSGEEKRKYSTVDLGLLSLYNDPKADSISSEFKLKDEDAANLSSRLLSRIASEESEHIVRGENLTRKGFILNDFAVKSDINEKGMQRANKEKVEVKDSKKKVFQMEDESVCLYPFSDDVEMAFFAVFDGHAGNSAAKAAKALLPQEFGGHLRALSGRPASGGMASTFRKTFQDVDNAMDVFQYEGCTATAVFLWCSNGKRYVQAANVGDSCAYLSRGNQVINLTKEHKVKDAEELKRLAKLGIKMNEGQTRLHGLALCRTLGDSFLKKEKTGVISEPFISDCIELDDKESTLIIASDGLWDVVSGKRAMEIVKDEKSASDKATKLINTALSSPKCNDNITIIVVTM